MMRVKIRKVIFRYFCQDEYLKYLLIIASSYNKKIFYCICWLNIQIPSSSCIFSNAIYFAFLSCSNIDCCIRKSLSILSLILFNSWYLLFDSLYSYSRFVKVFCNSWFCFFKRILLSSSVLSLSFNSFN